MEIRQLPPHPIPLPKGEGEHSARLERPSAPGRSIVQVLSAALAPSFDASDRSQHSPNVDEAFAGSPSPRGRGRGEGEGFFRSSIASPILQITLPTAKNHITGIARYESGAKIIFADRQQRV